MRNAYACRGLGVLFLTASLMLAAVPASADEKSLLSFLGKGKAQLSFRYRFETVDQDGLAKDAKASTLRTRLTYTTPKEHEVQLVLEADNVLRLGGALYSDGNRSVPGYPVVADPIGTEINQAYLRLAPSAASTFDIGRQRINFDDQRFIGGVGWRQNEQTYDAARADFGLAQDTTLTIAYLWNINRIFGPEGGAQASDWACRCYALNLSASPWAGAKLSAFAYGLDIEDAASQANRTQGIRLTGSRKVAAESELAYQLTYASQTDTGERPVDYRASYLHGRLELARGKLRGRAGLELLGGDSSVSGAMFVTPLATLHAFNGWADKFLGIPDAGLKDVYLGVDLPIGGATASITWHSFSAEDGNADYGTEWDLAIARKFKNGFSVLGKLADYQSDGFASDTSKAWLMLTYQP